MDEIGLALREIKDLAQGMGPLAIDDLRRIWLDRALRKVIAFGATLDMVDDDTRLLPPLTDQTSVSIAEAVLLRSIETWTAKQPPAPFHAKYEPIAALVTAARRLVDAMTMQPEVGSAPTELLTSTSLSIVFVHAELHPTAWDSPLERHLQDVRDRLAVRVPSRT